MKSALWKGLVVGSAVIIAAAACDDNPVDEGVDQVQRVSFNKTFASVAPGDSIQIAATPLNRYGAPLGADVTFTACDTKVTVASTARDTADLAEAVVAWVRATTDAANLGYTCVEAAAGGVRDTVRVLVVPDYPVTDVSSADAGATVTVNRAEGQPVYDDNTGVEITDAILGTRTAFVTGLSEDQLTFVVPYSIGTGTKTITVTNTGAEDADISGDFEITSASDPNDTDFGSEGSVSMPFDMYSKVSDSDVDDVFEFTAAADGTIDVYVDWDEGATDLDLYLLDATQTLDLVHSWYDQPEHITYDVTAGTTYYIYVNNYGAEGPTTYHLWGMTQ